MIVENNGIHYALENRLVSKLDLMIKRCMQDTPKKDALLLIEGAEGEGKTNSSCAVSYYIKTKTNREIHMFFRLNDMIQFAKSTEDKIIIWDEPALDSLSTDWYKEASKDLMRLLMSVRKKRHFFIFNLTKFHKFAEYIVVDRALGMVHMYSRHETEAGRFVYIRKRSIEWMFLSYRRSKKRLYNKSSSFRGRFPEVMEKYFNLMNINVNGKVNASLNTYDKEKDKAIESIASKKPDKHKDKVLEMQKKIASIKIKGVSQEELAKALGITRRTLYNWQLEAQNDTPSNREIEIGANIISTGNTGNENE
jgi:DNA-binding transcriptional regulator YiaG